MRPTLDEYFMRMVGLVATRGTCRRRQVGCVLVDRRGHVLATGYNGSASGQPHCTDAPCPGADQPPGAGLELCEAIHSEQNALLQCRDPYAIKTCYVSCSPCVTCTKLLLNTSCLVVMFAEPYAHDDAARRLWTRAGREWVEAAR